MTPSSICDLPTPDPAPLSWDAYFIALATAVALKSKDPNRRVGAVITDAGRTVRATGFNGFPRGLADDARLLDRKTKLRLVVHAEANAICAAARVGVPLDGSTLWCTHPPCVRCAALIIQAGIVRIAFPDVPLSEPWAEEAVLAFALLREAGVVVGPVAP